VGAKTAVSDSVPIDSGTIYAQPCVFRALANIQGLDALPCTRRANARDDVHRTLDRRVTKKHAQNRNTPGCGLHPLNVPEAYVRYRTELN
jgi:hypothetical protein